MNRSYSKIRHIQESNQRLENRLLNEQKQTLSSEDVKLLMKFLSGIKHYENKKSEYIVWKQDSTNKDNIPGRSVLLTGKEDIMGLGGLKQNTPMIWSLYKNGKKIDDTYFKIEKVSGNCRLCNKLIYSLYPGIDVGDNMYLGKGSHNIPLESNVDKAIQTFNGIQKNVS